MEGSCGGWDVGAGARRSGVAKGVIIPQGVAYCCLSLCDKTKRTGLGSIAERSGFYSAA